MGRHWLALSLISTVSLLVLIVFVIIVGAYQQPMPPPPHVGMPSYKMGGSPYQQPQQQQQPMHHPQQQPGGQPQQPQYLPNPMYMQHPRPPMGPGGPSPYGPGSYGPQQQPPPPPPQQQQQPGAGGGMPPNNSNTNQSPMPPASPGPNRSMPPHMGPPTPYPGYPPGLCSTHTFVWISNINKFRFVLQVVPIWTSTASSNNSNQIGDRPIRCLEDRPVVQCQFTEAKAVHHLLVLRLPAHDLLGRLIRLPTTWSSTCSTIYSSSSSRKCTAWLHRRDQLLLRHLKALRRLLFRNRNNRQRNSSTWGLILHLAWTMPSPWLVHIQCLYETDPFEPFFVFVISRSPSVGSFSRYQSSDDGTRRCGRTGRGLAAVYTFEYVSGVGWRRFGPFDSAFSQRSRFDANDTVRSSSALFSTTSAAPTARSSADSAEFRAQPWPSFLAPSARGLQWRTQSRPWRGQLDQRLYTTDTVITGN